MRRLTVHTLLLFVIGLMMAMHVSPAKAQGYQRSTLFVENLVCSSCLGLIEANLQKVPGVIGMTADMQSAIVIVDHTLRISGEHLAEAISSYRYPARLVSQEVIADNQVTKFSKSFAKCGVGGCSTGGCNATASAWKELYRKFIK